MTEEEIEQKANTIRKNEKDRLQFCKDVGITEDEFFVNRNGDFEIEDMVRAFERGKQSRDCNCMTYLNFKDLERENEDLKRQLTENESDCSMCYNKWHKVSEEGLPENKPGGTLYLLWTVRGNAGSPVVADYFRKDKNEMHNIWTGATLTEKDVVSWKEIKLPTE